MKDDSIASVPSRNLKMGG